MCAQRKPAMIFHQCQFDRNEREIELRLSSSRSAGFEKKGSVSDTLALMNYLEGEPKLLL